MDTFERNGSEVRLQALLQFADLSFESQRARATERGRFKPSAARKLSAPMTRPFACARASSKAKRASSSKSQVLLLATESLPSPTVIPCRGTLKTALCRGRVLSLTWDSAPRACQSVASSRGRRRQPECSGASSGRVSRIPWSLRYWIGETPGARQSMPRCAARLRKVRCHRAEMKLPSAVSAACIIRASASSSAKAEISLKLGRANCVRRVWRHAALDQAGLTFAQARNFRLEFSKFSFSKTRIGAERFLKHHPTQAHIAERVHTFQRRVARVGNAGDAGARRFASSPRSRDFQVVGSQLLQPSNCQFLQPGEEVGLFVFQKAAHCGQFQVRMGIDQAGDDCCLAQVVNCRPGEFMGQRGAAADGNDPVSVNRNRTSQVIGG